MVWMVLKLVTYCAFRKLHRQVTGHTVPQKTPHGKYGRDQISIICVQNAYNIYKQHEFDIYKKPGYLTHIKDMDSILLTSY